MSSFYKKCILLGVSFCLISGMNPGYAQVSVTSPELNIRIVGTASFQGKQTALIEDLNTNTDSFYKVGDPIYGHKIIAISADGITLEKNGKSLSVGFETNKNIARTTAPDSTGGKETATGSVISSGGKQTASVSPNFYTSDTPKSTTRWDLFTPDKSSKKEVAEKKRPEIAGKEIASVSARSKSGGRFGMPVANYKRLSSGFGYRKHPIGGGTKMHKGIDFSANKGTRILSADSGVVTFSGWKGGYGYCIVVDHQNGYETLYGHCSKLIADVGDNVRRGDLVAQVGSTGASTGNHLHFEVHKNKTPINPTQFFPNL